MRPMCTAFACRATRRCRHRIGLTVAAVTALIDRLEKAGYVVRERGLRDHRRITVHANREKLRQVNTLYGKARGWRGFLCDIAMTNFV